MKGTASGGTKEEDVPFPYAPPQGDVESGRAHHHNLSAVQLGDAPTSRLP